MVVWVTGIEPRQQGVQSAEFSMNVADDCQCRGSASMCAITALCHIRTKHSAPCRQGLAIVRDAACLR